MPSNTTGPNGPTPTSLVPASVPAPTPGTEISTGAQVIALSAFRGDVARSLMRRGKSLLLSDNLAEEVQAMAPLELYYVIKEVGVEEGSPLLLAADDEQFALICDLDCWTAEGFDADELDAWLAPVAAESTELLAETFLRLDEEVQVLFLQASLRVLDNREQDGIARSEEDEVPWPDDVPEDAPHTRTPEGFFTLFDISGDREVPPFMLVGALMAYDNNEGFRLLTAARWELESALLEQGRHFRQARLLDFGFDAPEDAVRLFAAPPALPHSAAEATPGAKLPVHLRAAERADGAGRAHDPDAERPVAGLPALYAEAFAEGDAALTVALGETRSPGVLAELERQLCALISTAVIAYGHGPKDVAHVGQVARWVRDTVSLGLWTAAAHLHPELSQPDAGVPESAAPEAQRSAWAQALVQLPLLHLFQHGVAAARPLQRRAQQAHKDEAVRTWLAATPTDGAHDPEAQSRALLVGLLKSRPLWGGQVQLRPDLFIAWRRPADVAAAHDQLDGVLARL